MNNEQLSTNSKGLNSNEVQSLQLKFGKNKFEGEPQRRFLNIFIDRSSFT